ncbi:MAG TPA: sigma-54 dependent transcriptional regulator [Thermoanaerobaculia bacterium]|nr:sigma-54 dependent transcriptional regulator [Thermoanaerobaculia bacterium]
MSPKRNREPRLRDYFRTRNAAMTAVLETVGKVLDHDVSILILGESGTGKDYLAEAIHACSTRRAEPFVHVECASIPADLFESELFGYERGTFTGAQTRKIGRLEAARRGTVYFDEIAALSPSLQAKLLRVMQEKQFTRLGGGQSIAFNARVISSSNADLNALLANGDLRRDFFYRVNVVTLTIPPLRERREDALALAKQFAGRRKTFSDDAAERIATYAWPGNIRELRNVIERAVLLTDSGEIAGDAFPIATDFTSAAVAQQWTLDELESRYIREILRQTRSNYTRAAEILGINRKTLLEKRKKYGID